MGAHHVVRHWIQRIAVAALSLAAGAGGLAGVAKAQVLSATGTSLSGFGVSGWLAPGANAFLTPTGDTQRGIAFNPFTGNLVMPSRAGGTNIAILSGTSGDLVKTMTTGTGVITGGVFPVNLPGVGSDGAVYVANLTNSGTVPFKVYKWDSEASVDAPSTVFNALSGVARTGDSFAVFGGGSTAQFVAAGTTGASILSNFLNGSLDNANTGVLYSVPNTSTNSNDYRLGLTYVDANTIIGSQGEPPARLTSFNGTSAVVDASIQLSGTASGSLRQTAFLEVGGSQILAAFNPNNGQVRLFNIDDPTSPASLLSQGFLRNVNFPATPNSNVNGSGGIAWGNVVDNGDLSFTVPLYALATNNGIQAFSVTFQAVPEPSTWAMLATGATACGWAVTWRKRRRKQLAKATETLEA